MSVIYRFFAVALLAFLLSPDVLAQPLPPNMRMQRTVMAQPGLAPVTGATVPCEDGLAGGTYPCENVELLAFLPIADLGGDPVETTLNDIWGWTDPETGREYALVGRSDGTAFVDVTAPTNPVYLGDLLSHDSTSSVWRDVKVYEDHALIVSEAAAHGMQTFDLTQLRNVSDPPQTFVQTARYDRIASAHNVVVNEETGYAFAVGSRGSGSPCGVGLHMIDVRDPANPTFAGCFDHEGTGRQGTGYTHDAQCVVYRGPDVTYQGREICFNANETDLSIADVTDKENPTGIARAAYPVVGYVHQGWLSEDQRYFFQDDELDETNRITAATRTIIWDVEDLDDPQVAAEYFAATPSIDHNQYTVGDLLYQANYTSGLRLLDVRDPTRPVEVGFFDTFPAGDSAAFDGAWSNYPFFASGIVVVSSIGQGLFVLRPSEAVIETGVTTESEAEVPEAFRLLPAHPNPFNPQTTLTLTLGRPQRAAVAVYDVLGREVRRLHTGPLAAGEHRFTFDGAGLPSGLYLVHAHGETGSDVQTVTLVQ